MDREEIYLLFPAVILGFFVFLCVILSLMFGISFMTAFPISAVLTGSILVGLYLYRKKNGLSGVIESDLENMFRKSKDMVHDYFEDKYSSIYWKYHEKPVQTDDAGEEENEIGVNFLAGGDKPFDWNVEVIKNVEREKFKDLCEHFLRLSGVVVQAADSAKIGGADLGVYKPAYSQTQPIAIVLCSVSDEAAIGIGELKKLVKAMSASRVKAAFFFTNNQFDQDVIEFVQKNSVIRLFDGDKLIEKIVKMSDEKKQFLLEKIS